MPDRSPDESALVLEALVHQDVELTSSEFISIFRWLDSISKAIVLAETASLIDYAISDSRLRREVIERSYPISLAYPSPLEVLSVRRRSPWSVIGQVAVGSLMTYMLGLLRPTVAEAYSESRLREMIKSFFRDRLFMGAAATAEKKAARIRRYGNMKVNKVEETRNPDGNGPKIRLLLDRSEIIQPAASDRQSLEEILKRLLDEK